VHFHVFLHPQKEEIERAWQIMDPLIAATERPDAPRPEPYAIGSWGPRCADELLTREGRAWTTLCQH
jgi:glucose-6-phosphate 1-dehydrogenase